MEQVNSYDFGGRELNVSEVITDELLGTIQGLNRDLGTPNDPYYNEFKSFVDEINSAELVLIDPNILSRSTYDDMDLSGISSAVSTFAQSLLMAIGGREPLYIGNITENSESMTIGGREYLFSDERMCETDGVFPQSAS